MNMLHMLLTKAEILRDGNGEKLKSLKMGVREPSVRSRGNAPGGGERVKPPEAEGFF